MAGLVKHPEQLDCVEEMLFAYLASGHRGLTGVKPFQWIDAVAQLLAALPPDRTSLWLLVLSTLWDQQRHRKLWLGHSVLAYRVEYWLNKAPRRSA
jgi:hypothetical protein